MRADDLPREKKLPCAQRPIKRVESEKYALKYVISFGEAVRGGFPRGANLTGKNIFRAQKTKFPVWDYTVLWSRFLVFYFCGPCNALFDRLYCKV